MEVMIFSYKTECNIVKKMRNGLGVSFFKIGDKFINKTTEFFSKGKFL